MQQYLNLRWDNRRSVFHPRKPFAEVKEFDVQHIPPSEAKPFVAKHHYSGCACAYDFANYGLFWKGILSGVATFAACQNKATVQRYAGHEYEQGVELGRFVLLDEPGYNSESWFLARAMEQFKQLYPARKAVISYSDPHPRINRAGETVFPGHIGNIYRASNALFAGRGQRRKKYTDADGRTFAERNFSKIIKEESGWAYALRELERASETPRGKESLESYVWRAKRQLSTFTHPGNYVYVFPLAANRREKKQILNTPQLQELANTQTPNK
jgi:hypothetical protein